MNIKIVKNAKGGFDLVLGDKIVAHHETEDAAKQSVEALSGDDEDDGALNAKINSAINAALSAREKRFNEQLAKTLPETVKGVLGPMFDEFKKSSGAQPGDDPAKSGGQNPGGPPKPDPEFIKLREQHEQLAKKYAESEQKRAEIEERGRRDSARGELRKFLEAKGVKPSHASALIAHMETSGSLRFNDEGKPELVVKRARSRGGAPEDLAFDIAAGVEDWSKTDDAKEWLPAATGMTQPPRGGPFVRTAPKPGTAPRYDKPATTDEEMARRAAESLAAKGVDVIDAYRR